MAIAFFNLVNCTDKIILGDVIVNRFVLLKKKQYKD